MFAGQTPTPWMSSYGASSQSLSAHSTEDIQAIFDVRLQSPLDRLASCHTHPTVHSPVILEPCWVRFPRRCFIPSRLKSRHDVCRPPVHLRPSRAHKRPEDNPSGACAQNDARRCHLAIWVQGRSDERGYVHRWAGCGGSESCAFSTCFFCSFLRQLSDQLDMCAGVH